MRSESQSTAAVLAPVSNRLTKMNIALERFAPGEIGKFSVHSNYVLFSFYSSSLLLTTSQKKNKKTIK